MRALACHIAARGGGGSTAAALKHPSSLSPTKTHTTLTHTHARPPPKHTPPTVSLAEENALAGTLRISEAFDELMLAHKKEVYCTIVTAEVRFAPCVRAGWGEGACVRGARHVLPRVRACVRVDMLRL